MLLQDTREMLIEAEDGGKGLNPYWEKLLPEKKWMMLKGFDFACEEYGNAFENTKMEISMENTETLGNIKTEIVGKCQEDVEEQVGYMRNEFVVSMIDDISEEEYQKIYYAALSEVRTKLGDNGIKDLYSEI